MTKSLASTALALAVLASLAAAPGRAEPYTLFIFEGADQIALREAQSAEGKAYWDSYAAFAKEITDAGILRGGSALMTDGPAHLVSAGGARTDEGGFAKSVLPLGGYFQIDVPTEAEALAWAAKVPVGETGMVEIRAGYPAPGM